MKWVKRVVMIVLALGLLASSILAVMAFVPWRKAEKRLTEVKMEKYTAPTDDTGYALTTKDNQESVVFIALSDGKQLAYGSGYAVGALDEDVQYFVTNGHVVQLHQEGNFDLRIYFDAETYEVPEVVFYQYDSDLDMSILKIDNPTDLRKPVIIRDSSEVEPGERCTAIGYPDKANKMDSTFSSDIASQTVTSGVISKTDVMPMGQTFKTFQHDAFITHGNSGGPLFDPNGFFIGMNTEGRTDTESVNFSIVSNEVTKILKKNDIEYIDSEDYLDDYESEQESNHKSFLKKIDSKVKEQEEIISSEKKKFIIFASIAAACGVALLIVAIVANKKVVMVGEQDDGKKAYLLCTRGLYAGQRYEITGKTMTIGRDQNSCTIIFPENTPGISSNHCSIFYDARTKSFILTDNGSTYGTYLADGRKLTKGVQEKLMPGATFSLADKVNEFMVNRE